MTEQLASYRRILKSSSIIGGSSVINILIGLLRTKVLAILIGPSGVGLVSLYTSLGDGKFNLIFNILTERSIKIQLLDALGNSISESEEMIKPGQEKAYDYRDLKPGMYFIRVFDGKTIISFKYKLIKL